MVKDFLIKNLNLELHKQKSKIISLSRGIDFVGFRSFYYHKLLRKRNIKSMKNKIKDFSKGKISPEKMTEIFQGWSTYAKWANTYRLRLTIIKNILETLSSS